MSSYNHFKKDYCDACGCSASSFNPLDVDHIKTRGSGGLNEAWNCWTLCRTHHIEKGWSLEKFVNKWPRAKEWLLANRWEFEEFRNKWVHYFVEQPIIHNESPD
jgi:5-methylcytosine-specific restriction endonuclease McrA